MGITNDNSFKPIILKTSLGFDYFSYDEIIMIMAEGNCTLVFTLERDSPERTLYNLSFIEKKYCNKKLYRCHKSYIINLIHIEKLLTKTHQVHLKKNLVVPLSEHCLRMIRQMSVNSQNLNYERLFQEKPDNKIFNKMRWMFAILTEIGMKFKKTFRRFVLFSIPIILLFVFSQCESNDRFYRPNMPEKLCCIGIIDADDTTNYTAPFPEFLATRNISRYISFEKSFQMEYPEEVNDSLREFSFNISTEKEEIFDYHINQTIKNLLKFKIPNSIKFVSGEKYILGAREKYSNEISAEVTVPDPPPYLSLLSINKEITTLSEPENCIGTTTVKSAVIDLSFENNNQKSYYAILLEGIGYNFSSSFLGGDPYLLEFAVKESNTSGFFAIIHGLKMYQSTCKDNHASYIQCPVNAYFIEGSKIPYTKCIIKISTQFNDGRSFFETIKSFRIKLLSIPEELYFFEKSLFTYGKVSKDPFSEPVYLNGNIKEGNGVFAICRSTELTIKFSPWY